jgi:hypothetical protein
MARRPLGFYKRDGVTHPIMGRSMGRKSHAFNLGKPSPASFRTQEEKEELALAHMSGIIYATTDDELKLCRNLVKKGYLKEDERPKHGFTHTFRLTSEGKEVAKQAYNEIVKQDERGR